MLDTAYRHPAYEIPFDTLHTELEKRVEQGLISTNTLDGLVLYTYTQDCVVERAWDRYTKLARGLVLAPAEKKVVAVGFEKFFNYGEESTDLPDCGFHAFEKMDGSLIIAFFHNKELFVITKGSFQSEQAVWAKQWIENNIDVSELSVGCSYLFEVIYPENRIVVKYDFEGLVLLSIFDPQGYEVGVLWSHGTANRLDCRVADVHEYDNLDDMLALAKTMDISSEGWVVRFDNGYRIKIKGDEYCRVHKLISYCTPLAIWEMMANLDDLDALRRDLPEEFWADFDNIRSIIQRRFDDEIQELHAFYVATKDFTDKELGLSLCDNRYVNVSRVVKDFVFACRKNNFLKKVLEKPDKQNHARIKFFKHLRPTSNKLEGYKPSSIVNRFDFLKEESKK